MTEAKLDDLLRRAAATHRLAVERALADLGVTLAQYAVLKTVFETPGISNAEIARAERLTPQTTSLVLANLERKRAVLRRARGAELLKPPQIAVAPSSRERIGKDRR